jgi:polyhydroxyalkanoate synthesis repressor PhaR
LKHHPQQKPGKILIKKYSNRRLYDVTHSQYLTQDELVDLVKSGSEVSVVDSKTKHDITQTVLTQILLEKGKNGTYLFSSSFLHQLIRYRDGILAEFFTDFVPKMLESYLEMKDKMQRQISSIASPVTWLTATTKDLKVKMTPAHLPAEPTDAGRGDPEELALLRTRIHELESQLNQKLQN